jgi:hypothetical protein
MEEGEIEKERVGKVCIYWLLPMESLINKCRRYSLSVIPTVNGPRHWTEILVWIPRSFRW